jgi:hypothetical protein
MRIKDLEGNEHIWSLQGYGIGAGIAFEIEENKSSFHLMARELLQELYPTQTILEEVPIRVHRNENLYLDFYLPLRKMAIEVQGKQHDIYIPHFHKTLRGFTNSKQRDEDKLNWCNLNNISLIYFNHTESTEEWKAKLI